MNYSLIRSCLKVALVAIATSLVISAPSLAITPLPIPDPIPGSYGLEATKTKSPPTVGATITTPGNGTSTRTPTTVVSGICPSDLLVEIYNNKVMSGSAICNNGSFRVTISLFPGQNDLTAMVYDELDQSGPVSNTVRVTFTDLSLTAFSQSLTLTSSYGRRAAPAGGNLVWPIQLSGGTGPYAFSIDWGDGSKPDLKSLALAGVVNLNHSYQKAGIYQVNITATDSNGVSAFLQVVAVSSGQVTAASTSTAAKDTGPLVIVKIIWIPAVIALILLIPAYLLGRRSQLVSLRHKMLKERDQYEAEKAKQ